MQLPNSRAAAQALGVKHYFTGKPCKNGHLAPKFTSQGSCVECELKRTQKWRETPENKEKVRANNRLREPASRAAYNRERARRKRLRTPAWANREALEFFKECRPAGCHTDHVIPLLGEQVLGLHVAENLQWVPDVYNLTKRNDFAPTRRSLGRAG